MKKKFICSKEQSVRGWLECGSKWCRVQTKDDRRWLQGISFPFCLARLCHNGLWDKPIFSNEEDKLLSFSFCFWVTKTQKVLAVTSFYCEVFCSRTDANCCFCDAMQTERNNKHWFTVGCRLRFGDHQTLWGGQEERQLNHRLTCLCVCETEK